MLGAGGGNRTRMASLEGGEVATSIYGYPKLLLLGQLNFGRAFVDVIAWDLGDHRTRLEWQ